MERTGTSRPDNRAIVKARVKHLPHYEQIALARATRILKAYFVDNRPRAPKQGTLLGIMLVDPSVVRDEKPGSPLDERPHFELWAFVDHPVYRGLNKHWGRARAVLESEITTASISLSVFTADEIERLRRENNRFLVGKFEAGIMLYESGETDKLDTPSEHGNKVARSLLRMALVLLDRDGEMAAAADVASALDKLGEVSPPLTDAEATALLDQWEAQRRNRSAAN